MVMIMIMIINKYIIKNRRESNTIAPEVNLARFQGTPASFNP